MHQPVAPLERDWMGLRELAARLGIGETVAYELANQDRLPIPAHRIGRQFRFSRNAYEALLNRQHGEAMERQQAAQQFEEARCASA
jgi:excisionase family DNA binding protein